MANQFDTKAGDAVAADRAAAAFYRRLPEVRSLPPPFPRALGKRARALPALPRPRAQAAAGGPFGLRSRSQPSAPPLRPRPRG